MLSVYKKSSLFLSILIASNIVLANSYQKADNVSGVLSSSGSSTLKDIIEHSGTEFVKIYPGIKFSSKAAGSSSGPKALIDGSANIGTMSRKIKSKEVDKFLNKFGYKPTEIKIAIDALGVYVHKDNPLTQISIDQIDAIYSKARKCGYKEAITNWSQLGGNDGSIAVYGRNNQSGTHGYFKKKALCKGKYNSSVSNVEHANDVVNKISSDINAVGYSGIGNSNNPNVKLLAIAKKGTTNYVEATKEMTSQGKYPLGRYLYVYVNKKPGEPLGMVEKEFIKFLLATEGQKIIEKYNFISVSDKIIKKQLKSIE